MDQPQAIAMNGQQAMMPSPNPLVQDHAQSVYPMDANMLNGTLAPGALGANAFSLAPGDGRHAAPTQPPTQQSPVAEQQAPGSSGHKTLVMDYTKDFPELPHNDNNNQSEGGAGGAWGKPLPKLKSSAVTQVFHMPPEDRRTSPSDLSRAADIDTCNEIAAKAGVEIELFERKDRTLTVVVTGKRQMVEEARKQIVARLQAQCAREVRIPKEHHRVIIGQSGGRLRELEHECDCTIRVPGRDEQSDMIRVVGPKEGVEKAVHKIQGMSDTQAQLAQEHLVVPRIFYPWIRGPYNETLDNIQKETGVRVNIPPPSANSEVIVVAGEKEGVKKAAQIIKHIFEEQQRVAQTISCEIVKTQHRYIIGERGSGLADILKETGVSVEVPPEQSDSCTITLRGEQTRLALALPLVYRKASSVITAQIDCPAWLHRYIIGQKGATIQEIVGEDKKVQVDFDDSGHIFMQGPPEGVRRIDQALREHVDRLQKDLAVQKIKVPVNFHRHVIGKGGGVVSKIKADHNVQISIPSETDNSDLIKVEGPKEGVDAACAEIAELAQRLANEKTQDVMIESRFHGQLIGAKGESVRELRDKFPGVQLSFPEPGRKSNIVQLRGPKEQVDKCAKHLLNVAKELKENNFQVRVPIFKGFHSTVIGKGGRNVAAIREQTNCRIDVPAEQSGDDFITVTGRREHVEKATAMLVKIQNELAAIETAELKIPQKLHSRLMGAGGRLVNDISEQCGGVHIKFPDAKTGSDVVTIRGPKEEVAKAHKLLSDMAKDRELASFEDKVKFKPELRRFMIGPGGSTIRKIRDVCPDVRIMFPREQDQDQENILLVGRKDEVAKIKAALEQLIKQMAETVEISMEVDPTYHRHFVQRGAHVLHDIQDQCGGVMISFPKPNTASSKVTIKGGKDGCAAAKKQIETVVDDLKASVTEPMFVAQEHHRVLLSGRGAKVNEIQNRLKVHIKFPERNAEGPVQNPETEDDKPEDRPENIIQITGRPENIEMAKEELLALVPITVTVPVPFDMHGSLIGKGGGEIRKFMNTYDVNVRVPPGQERRDEIYLTGTKVNVEQARQELDVKVQQHADDMKDKELRSFEARLSIPQSYYPRLIGPRGSAINALRAKHDVNITIPQMNVTAEGAPNDIVVTGYEKNAEACKQEILDMVQEMEAMFRQEITLDHRVHSRIIGPKGRNVKKVKDDFKVEITFPPPNAADPNVVTVVGKDEDTVYDCIDHLRLLEQDFLEDMVDRPSQKRNVELGDFAGDQLAPAAAHKDGATAATQPHAQHGEVKIMNAPWTAPDVNSAQDFPSIGGEQNGGDVAPVAGAWGRRRH